MTDNQRVLIELLDEINALCRANKWSYFASEPITLQAIRTGLFENDSVNLSIYMPVQDFVDFASYTDREIPENRYIESMLNNEKFPGIMLFYGNNDSLDFNTQKWKTYINHGIHIKVEPIRAQVKNRRLRRAQDDIEKAWESFINYKREGERREKAVTLLEKIIRVTGQKRAAAVFFKILTASGKHTTPNIYLRKIWSDKRRQYNRHIFDDYREVSFEGINIRVPKNYEDYLLTAYGESWLGKDLSNRTYNPVFRLVDDRIPFADFLQELKDDGIDTEEVWKDRQEFLEENKRLELLRRRREKAWAQLFLSSDRFAFWNMYKDSKIYLKELKRSDRPEAILEELAPYISAMRKHWQNRLGLNFDREVIDLIQYAYEQKNDLRNITWLEKVKNKVPKQHWEPVVIKDYTGKIIEEREAKGMRRATNKVIPAILEYLKRNVGDCVYMYVDIAKYGLDNPNMAVWYDADDDGICLVVMKYYDSIQVFTEKDDYDTEAVINLIREYKPGMISGRSDLVELLYPLCTDTYNFEKGYVFKLTRFRAFDSIVPIKRVGVEKCKEIARFICSNESIGGYYDVDNLTKQLAERIETGIGRSLIITGEDGTIKGHIATYAEFDGIATTAGLLAVDDGSGIPYGTMLESRLVNDLLNENYTIFTFVTEDRRARFFRAMKCVELNRYGKMTIKEESKNA